MSDAALTATAGTVAMTTGDTTKERTGARFGKEPTARYRDLDARAKRFIFGAIVTLFAVVLLVGYLLPLAFMTTSALKTEEQLANGRILPMSPETVTIDGTEYPAYRVEIEGVERTLALTKPGRQQSTFLDPAEPDQPIIWEGNWRLLNTEDSVDPQFSNFPEAWRGTTPDFPTLLKSTIIIAVLGMVATVISSTFVAYGLSRFRIPGKRLILASLLATIILPGFVTLIPRYVVYVHLGWIGTILPLVVPHLFSNAYNVFLMRQFFLTIPRELDEAAAIDGAGPVKTLLTVILPQAKGAILAVSLFHFFFAWNDFLEPLIFLQGHREWIPVSVGLYQFLGIYDTNLPLVMAAAVIAMALPLLIFIALQRVFLRGIDLSGSIK